MYGIMSSGFVVFPDQLIYTDSALAQLRLHTIIYVVEDPVVFNLSNKAALIFSRAATVTYKQWLAEKLTVEIKYVRVSDIKAKGDTIFDYFIGSTVQLYAWRLSHHWGYNDRQYEYTYAGIQMKFVESPQYLSTYSSIRDNCKSHHNYSVGAFAKKIFSTMNMPESISRHFHEYVSVNKSRDCSRVFDYHSDEQSKAVNAAAARYARKFTFSSMVKFADMNTVEYPSAEGIVKTLDKFIDMIMPNYIYNDIYVLMPLINVSSITPRQIITAVCARRKHCGDKSIAMLIYDLACREYNRMIYISNSEYDDAGESITQNITLYHADIATSIEQLKKCKIKPSEIISAVTCMWFNIVDCYADATAVCKHKKINTVTKATNTVVEAIE